MLCCTTHSLTGNCKCLLHGLRWRLHTAFIVYNTDWAGSYILQQPAWPLYMPGGAMMGLQQTAGVVCGTAQAAWLQEHTLADVEDCEWEHPR